MSNKIEIGDAVQLNGGSPTMTVTSIDDLPWITCTWFAFDGTVTRGDFRAEWLTRMWVNADGTMTRLDNTPR